MDGKKFEPLKHFPFLENLTKQLSSRTAKKSRIKILNYLTDAIDEITKEEPRGANEELLPFRPVRQRNPKERPSLFFILHLSSPSVFLCKLNSVQKKKKTNTTLNPPLIQYASQEETHIKNLVLLSEKFVEIKNRASFTSPRILQRLHVRSFLFVGFQEHKKEPKKLRKKEFKEEKDKKYGTATYD